MNVSEFRANLKDCFDRAANGEIIEIERGGLVFHLAKRDFGKIYLDEASTLPEEALKKIKPVATPPNVLMETTPPRVKDNDTPVRTADEWQEAEAVEQPCCKLNKPCRHWQYNVTTCIWQNTLSGRQKEVEL